MRDKNELVEVTPLIGTKFKVLLPSEGRDALEDVIAKYGAYSHVQHLLVRLCGPGHTVIDVGAHLGTVTIPLALNGAHIIAYDILRSNVEAVTIAARGNDVSDRVVVRHAAAWHRSETLGVANINANGWIFSGGTQKVEAVRLDADVGLQRRIDAVKIDVEGAELNVLRGLDGILRKHHPHVVFENFPSGLAAHGASMGQVFSFLRGHGYRIYRLTLNVLSPAEVPEQLVTDFFASTWPEEKLARVTGYEIRPLTDQEIIEQIKVQVHNPDTHRIYLVSVAEHLRSQVADHQEVRPLLAEWRARYGDHPDIALYRKGVHGVSAERPRVLRRAFSKLDHWKSSAAAKVAAAVRRALRPKPGLSTDDLDARVAAIVRDLTRLTVPNGQPNINELWAGLKDIQILRLNTKNFGYRLAREAAASVLAKVDTSGEPRRRGLVSKPTTQADVESPWFSFWCAELKAAPLYHRKLWEFAFLLQVLFEHDLLREGARGVGFGCGEEPLASYFASKRVDVLVTDLAPEAVAGRGWSETGQHTSSKEKAFFPSIVSRDLFDRHVEHAYADMNDLPSFPQPFDFCWSVCALEHLGSIDRGLDFIANSLAALKPGGVAIHTTEYNYLSQDETIDNWPTVLFLRKHFEALKARLERDGHQVLGPDFDVGDGVLDRFIDVPPYAVGEGWLSREQWGSVNQAAHLKLAVDGFACTCFGLVIRKAPAGAGR